MDYVLIVCSMVHFPGAQQTRLNNKQTFLVDYSLKMRWVFPLTSCSKTLRNNRFGSICLSWHCLWCVYCTRVNYTNAERIFCKAQCSPPWHTTNRLSPKPRYYTALPLVNVQSHSPREAIFDPQPTLTSGWHLLGCYQGPALTNSNSSIISPC